MNFFQLKIYFFEKPWKWSEMHLKHEMSDFHFFAKIQDGRHKSKMAATKINGVLPHTRSDHH